MSKSTKQRQIANRIKQLLENEDTAFCFRKTPSRWRWAPSVRGVYPELFDEIDNLLDSVLADRKPTSERGMAAAIAYKLLLDRGHKPGDAGAIVAAAGAEYDAGAIGKYYRERYTKEADNIARNVARGYCVDNLPRDPSALARYVLDNFKDGKLPT